MVAKLGLVDFLWKSATTDRKIFFGKSTWVTLLCNFPPSKFGNDIFKGLKISIRPVEVPVATRVQ